MSHFSILSMDNRDLNHQVNSKKQKTFFRNFLQPKLSINQPNDVYEQEADAMAEKVMRMPDPAVSNNFFFKPAISSLQRKCEHCEEEEKKAQRKETNNDGIAASSHTENYLNTLSGGRELSGAERSFFEPRFGYDFSDVKIHTDPKAAKSAQSINALAYTSGNNIVFNESKFSPDTDTGKRLLGHELMHVIQQQSSTPAIQRKIMIAGKEYTPNASYYAYLLANFGQPMVDFISTMHNAGNPPIYNFKSTDEMGFEVRIRSNAIKGMNEVHKGCCNYPTAASPGGHLDPVFWVQEAGYMNFSVKTPLPAGMGPSDAIEAIFKPGAGTLLECLTMTLAIEYYSLLKGLGKDKFNKMFPAGAGLFLSPSGSLGGVTSLYQSPKYQMLTLGKADLLPGDWVYFKNFKDYPTKHPGGFWQGENALVMGKDKYRGFGVLEQSEDDLNKELVKEYNSGLPAPDQKTKTDLLIEGGGLLQFPVNRPKISEIIK